MKVIFLDIDGVINSIDNIYSRKVNQDRDVYGALFDERCVRWLDYIARDAKIVLSSSWRRRGLKKIREIWLYRKLPSEVIDVTPLEVNNKLLEKYKEQAVRGYEIQQWIESHKPEKYVILDDENDMLSIQNFVQTDPIYGLNHKTAQKALEYLR